MLHRDPMSLHSPYFPPRPFSQHELEHDHDEHEDRHEGTHHGGGHGDHTPSGGHHEFDSAIPFIN